mmetsp:Transcript_10007/g.22366  ORF Transcript_10007/g.22366 Transcript_10007/m.22366 type:complete len:200 (+) Transcript_10007:1432-2031(+)
MSSPISLAACSAASSVLEYFANDDGESYRGGSDGSMEFWMVSTASAIRASSGSSAVAVADAVAVVPALADARASAASSASFSRARAASPEMSALKMADVSMSSLSEERRDQSSDADHPALEDARSFVFEMKVRDGHDGFCFHVESAEGTKQDTFEVIVRPTTADNVAVAARPLGGLPRPIFPLVEVAASCFEESVSATT